MPARLCTAILDRRLPRWVPCLALFLLGGCSTVGYYGQLGSGQLKLLNAREPVAEVVADPSRDAKLRERLALSQQAREYASAELGLPDNRSYRVYSDIHRPYVVWNVFAAPELSLQPLTHCFPIAGCVAYRGFYAEAGANAEAKRLQAQGWDVFVGGVEAYSTLGWFDDPIISSMLRWDDQRLAETLFHELGHQRYYLPGDTAFNESYASFVEQEGGRRWRASRGLPAEDSSRVRQRESFTRLVLDTRERLQALYASPVGDEAKRAGKAAEFERLRRDYRELCRREWAGKCPYDAWVNGPLNNAKLLPFGLYDQWVPAFATLFRQVGGNWQAFYARVEKLGALPAAQRQAALEQLKDGRFVSF
ncbi:aminopeptidase [Pseudomonas citronellolis]|uniref:aminopeptidase n=1 Tax=Pseudomonas citronellolis TaxID=53408 RepID=UPI0023E40E3C|nr:aminopeptidase [Pseudomonas citronellolis]MDF3931697.1 aminopeptidase [Pseudomonas citronellolis]